MSDAEEGDPGSSSKGPYHPVRDASQEEDRKKSPLSKRKLEKLKEVHERRGVVYVSRIPPHMVRSICKHLNVPEAVSSMAACKHSHSTPAAQLQKPQKMRQLLEHYAEIGRIYLAPEGA